MTANVKPPTYEWRVTDMRPDTNIGPGSLPVSGQTLTFQVVDPPLSGTVFVPDSQKGNLGLVHSLIATEAAQLAALATLKSGQ